MSEEAITRQLVVFTLGDEEYALPIADVHEIIRYTEPRSVASSVDWVRGVISLRGKIVPVYDLASRLGCAREEDVAEQKIVIVEAATGTAGVVVDDVEEVLTVDDDQLESHPLGRRGRDRRDRQDRRPPGRPAQPRPACSAARPPRVAA